MAKHSRIELVAFVAVILAILATGGASLARVEAVQTIAARV